ncbi:MAG: ABC transporter ATP-binding protein [Myxococcota bacterium]
MELAVEIQGVTKRYPRCVANEDASLSLYAGEVHALVGENGAGKSTLMKVLAGVIRPDRGTVKVRGKPLSRFQPEESLAAGVGMVFQHFVLVGPLTVAENVVLGREPRRGLIFDRARAEAEVREVSQRFGLAVDPSARVEDLPVGVQQRVEILKVLYRGAEVIVLDEPTAILTPQEVDELLKVVRGLAESGKSILLISHKLREVMAAADRVTIMRRGKTIETLEVAKTSADAIAEKMIGRAPDPPQRAPHPVGPVFLEVRGLSARSDRGSMALLGVDLEIRGGEVLGVAGIEGNGQAELVECLAGLRSPSAGVVRLGGVDITQASVRERLAAGLAHVPDDRLRRAVVPSMTLSENALLGFQERFTRALHLEQAKLTAFTEEILRSNDVRPPDPEALVGSLSGGNQQKLVIGREMARHPKLVLAAHPTRGLDVAAMEHVDRALLAARDQGAAVLLVSAELSELLRVADRIIVLAGGKIAGLVAPDEVDERALGLMMSGASRSPG